MFSLNKGFGYRSIANIRKVFGTLEKAFNSNRLADWRNTGLKTTEIVGWFEFKKQFRFQPYFDEMQKKGINFIDFWSKGYPEKLKNIYSPPVVLYWRGDLDILDKNYVAVVGTRNHSEYGTRVTKYLVEKMVANGLGIVSGLALGIDAIAHKSCLDAGGLTMAVLGGGLDRITPQTNERIGERIIESGGVILSEVTVGENPAKWNFPARNRIVSALSAGVLVTEAPAKSGALITANFALEQGKSVMAVPGSIFNHRIRGCNNLISQGAVLVNDIEDIMLELGMKERENAGKIEIKYDNNLQQEIMEVLDGKTKVIDEIVMELSYDPGKVIAEINLMYLKGWIGEETGGRWYRKV
mgnify:CR=1 FL=1